MRPTLAIVAFLSLAFAPVPFPRAEKIDRKADHLRQLQGCFQGTEQERPRDFDPKQPNAWVSVFERRPH